MESETSIETCCDNEPNEEINVVTTDGVTVTMAIVSVRTMKSAATKNV